MRCCADEQRRYRKKVVGEECGEAACALRGNAGEENKRPPPLALPRLRSAQWLRSTRACCCTTAQRNKKKKPPHTQKIKRETEAAQTRGRVYDITILSYYPMLWCKVRVVCANLDFFFPIIKKERTRTPQKHIHTRTKKKRENPQHTQHYKTTKTYINTQNNFFRGGGMVMVYSYSIYILHYYFIYCLSSRPPPW